MHVLSIPYKMNRNRIIFVLDFNEWRSDSPFRVRSIGSSLKNVDPGAKFFV